MGPTGAGDGLPAGAVLITVDAVYAHAPFCARRCPYCDFAVTVDRAPSPEPWLRALAGELRALAEEGAAEPARELDTLYVGGGTPSLLGSQAMEGLADLLGSARVRAGATEWTAEANPESFTPEVAEGWRRSGVNRVSLGSQSFQDPVLRWMGRLHGADGAVRAVTHARRAGFQEVNVDLIFGLPDEVERDWDADLDRALELGVPHLSLYGLTAEAATPLGRRVREGTATMPDDDRYADEYLRAHERLTAEGYHAYEVSNFAIPGHESRHNRAYWEGRPYLGLGNGAHSHLAPERRWNLRSWDAYAAEALAGRLPIEDRERVEGADARLEAIWLGLRTDRGYSMADAPVGARALVDGWVRRGWARPEGERVVLEPEGWLLLDRLTVELDDAFASASGDGRAGSGRYPATALTPRSVSAEL